MSLTDIVSNMDLTVWPKIAMIIFICVFVAVVYRVVKRPTDEMERCSHIPLDDEPTETRHA